MEMITIGVFIALVVVLLTELYCQIRKEKWLKEEKLKDEKRKEWEDNIIKEVKEYQAKADKLIKELEEV